MFEAKVKLRKWGGSIGLILPDEKVKTDGLKEGEDVDIRVTKKTSVLKKTFGSLKSGKSTAKMLKEIRSELWNE